MTNPVPNEVMRSWQQLLVDAGYPMLPYGADGLGGQATHDALIAYQHAHGLTESGQFDEATRALLNPPHKPQLSIPPAVLDLIIGTALDAILPPSPAKEFLMFNFPSIVKFVIGLLPGLPDDVNKIRTAIGELVTDASDKNGIEGLRDSARFARIIADELDKVANTLDPSGAIQPANPIVNK